MQALRPRLLHKGLILLFVPLVFEIVVAAFLIYLQHYYGEAVKAEITRKQIVYHINEFWYYNDDITTTSLGTAMFGHREVNWASGGNASLQYKILAGLLADDPEQLKQLNDLMTSHLNIGKLCGGLRPFMPGSGGMLGQMLAMKSNLLTCKKLMAAELEIEGQIAKFREHQLRESERAAERVRSIALLIQVVLALAIAGSIAIAYLLFRYFMRGIHKGVQALIGNIKLFKSGEPLAQPLEGTDEIALLDSRFHEMADEVAAAQRLKQAFISTVTRELRVPIGATRDYVVELASGSDSLLSDVARTRAEKVEKSLDRLIGLMNDLLVLERPGAGRMEIAPRQCSLTEVVQSSIDAVQAFAEKNNVRLEGLNEQVSAYADPDRIVQVLVNLLSNAIKFSPAGSAVTISAQSVEDQVEIRVTDRGRGIPAHLRNAVFEKFQQVSTTDATEKGGTGLGLPICKEIIELHGGKIGVESEESKGSTFWFRVPAKGHDEA